MRVCLGGTFNILHKGHKKLFDKAIEVAGEKGILYIGLTRGEVIKKKTNVKSFEERKNEIESYFSRQKKTPIIKIIPISTKYDQSLIYDNYDAIV
ncbi:MAG: adenylyltransferase/cytidyltransferase family protein, partial [Candidatus Thermoplasmatota archaeon]|nr:adenylyltransferase/cytidyltransferase family protein [Candidatus Thermoplasmatota archaeon]